MKLSQALCLVALVVVLVDGRRLLPASSVFNQDVSGLQPSGNSVAAMGFLSAQDSDKWPHDFQVENSIRILYVDGNTQWVAIDKNGPDGYSSPDCDNNMPPMFPLPGTGGIEGTDPPSYSGCSGDCHLLVIDKAGGYFYEAYQANVVNGKLQTSCALRWCMTNDYPGLLGDQCTSADAAGYPITPLMMTVDEINDGVIDHALRMTLPNLWFGEGYVAPATHGTKNPGLHTSDPDAPYYGYRFRLKSSYTPPTNLPAAANIIITALKTYGIYLADGGNFAIMWASDEFSESGKTYDSFGLSPQTLIGAVKVSDFEVVQSDGTLQPVTYDCVPIAAPTSCSASDGGNDGNDGSDGSNTSASNSSGASCLSSVLSGLQGRTADVE